MDDIMGKISELLSDEESVKQLSELAQMLVSDSEKSGEKAEKADNATTEEQPDIASMLKLTSLIGEASKQDKNADLLLALKPHLSAEKQKRVDKALKLLKLLAIWNIAKESGLLQELI
ncbi:hypothetical protein [Ruminococcus flavefaciens]|uniref:Uncharacterized protein n=1 Tax=Ruminococcus flavefaciens TaxID=1265 RepID=A0A1K1LWI4_RUMFL|nr:hypothetical protein [Ruminococcus flavefaciens]SFW15226.1 hypothetical protein SAMN02910280_0818 [Ruminococcus flavefaciens]